MRLTCVSFLCRHLITLVLGCLLLSFSAAAKPVGPRLACQHYPDAPMCRGAVVSCAQCHTSPPELNGYGGDVSAALEASDLVYEDDLGAALLAVEGNDSDGDGLSNLEEIVLGTRPGDANS